MTRKEDVIDIRIEDVDRKLHGAFQSLCRMEGKSMIAKLKEMIAEAVVKDYQEREV